MVSHRIMQRDLGNRSKPSKGLFVEAVELVSSEDASLLIMGNSNSPIFPKELLPYTKRTVFGSGSVKLNFLVNYG